MEGSGTHTYPGHPKATWSGTVVPPTILFAKTRGFSGKVGRAGLRIGLALAL